LSTKVPSFVDTATRQILCDCRKKSRFHFSTQESQKTGSFLLVLLGDPQQLDQPQQGTHPPGTAASALEHLVGGATLEADRGLFLEETWRLHPEVCAFTSELYYEGKLTSVAQTHGQRVDGPAPFDGVGLRFVPVAHSGNSSESAEEVQVVREFVDALLAARPSRTRRGGWSSCSTRIG